MVLPPLLLLPPSARLCTRAHAGHYELNLTTPVHQAFAVRLKDIAYGEPNEGNNWYNIVYDMYSHAVKVRWAWQRVACVACSCHSVEVGGHPEQRITEFC